MPSATIPAEAYAKLIAMGGTLIPKQGILCGQRRTVLDSQGLPQVHIQIDGLVPFSHSDHDLISILNAHVVNPLHSASAASASTVVGWYCAPAVNVPTNSLQPRDVALCYFDTIESALLKVIAARRVAPTATTNPPSKPTRPLSINPAPLPNDSFTEDLAQEALPQLQPLLGVVIWLPCMSDSPTGPTISQPGPVSIPTMPNPTPVSNGIRRPTKASNSPLHVHAKQVALAHYHNSVDLHAYCAQTSMDKLRPKLRHPTCMTQAGPVETRGLQNSAPDRAFHNTLPLNSPLVLSTPSLKVPPATLPATPLSSDRTNNFTLPAPINNSASILVPCSLQIASAVTSSYLKVLFDGTNDRANIHQQTETNRRLVDQQLQLMNSFFNTTLTRKLDQYQRSSNEHDALVATLQFLDRPTEVIISRMKRALIRDLAASTTKPTTVPPSSSVPPASLKPPRTSTQ
ncbi:hypothetical protein H4R33_003564 [Dimargaris cristalligena]|nr:hypothetical protein H4R33_003564 [Dimargaris cristalligena]